MSKDFYSGNFGQKEEEKSQELPYNPRPDNNYKNSNLLRETRMMEEIRLSNDKKTKGLPNF